MTSIGWAGTGRMGFAMASRLLDAGHRVRVWNRTRAKAEPLAGKGAVVVGELADLAGCDVVFTMVSASADLEEVVLGDGGLLAAAPRILVDGSTVSPETSQRVRQAAADCGIHMLAAPVSGNAKAVTAGQASMAISGPREAYDEVEPLLLAIARSVTHLGEGDVARLVKICHNLLLGVVTQSLAEVTVLAERGGTSRAAFLEFVNGSVLGSDFTRYKTPAFVNLDLTPTFTPELLRKDFDLGMAAGRAHEVPMPLAALTHQLVQASAGAHAGPVDFAVLLLEVARSAGLVLEPEEAP
ncbi:NAD(P)-dependent oxidoreductase [Nonomuraea sp. NPDC050790]|uniref:NAD(P)-dependent oxidoreductase n=1 Tax=Nonomuraea sp. NPDC050790 TaxID=3364371 RepID=UPI00379D4DAA